MWAGQTASMPGDGVQGVALAWLTLALTGSPLTLGSVLLAGAVPRAAVVLLGGAVSDRLSPRAGRRGPGRLRGERVGSALAALCRLVCLRSGRRLLPSCSRRNRTPAGGERPRTARGQRCAGR